MFFAVSCILRCGKLVLGGLRSVQVVCLLVYLTTLLPFILPFISGIIRPHLDGLLSYLEFPCPVRPILHQLVLDAMLSMQCDGRSLSFSSTAL